MTLPTRIVIARLGAAAASMAVLFVLSGCLRDERNDTSRRRPVPGEPSVESTIDTTEGQKWGSPRYSGVMDRIVATLVEIERLDLGVHAISRRDGEMLRMLVRAVNAQQVLEIGTGTGYSGLWLCKGLEETGGRLTTYEIDANHARLAREHFREAGVDGRVTVVEGDAHQKVATYEGSIDLLFLDADPGGNVDYLRQLLPRVRENGLIVAHNMYRPPPDPRYITRITTDPTLHTLFLRMDGRGLGITQKRGRAPTPLSE